MVTYNLSLGVPESLIFFSTDPCDVTLLVRNFGGALRILSDRGERNDVTAPGTFSLVFTGTQRLVCRRLRGTPFGEIEFLEVVNLGSL